MGYSKQTIPVIFLAFANDKVDGNSYLRLLSTETSGIRTALKPAEKANLCELVVRTGASIDDILDVFQDSRYQDRIAIFHYGGHANGYQLLLETLEGSTAAAHSEGLVSFLSKQIGLKLIFLNGCSSQQQALDLVEAGIPAVIGTSQSINDDIATKLAIRFYKGMAVGKTIDRSWQEAIDKIKIEKGTANMREFFWEGMESSNTTQEKSLDRFPWEIHYKSGANAIKEWDLPEAVENPLFGLPPIPSSNYLPESPYLFFKRYEREHAELFFGRGSYIRKLYNLIESQIAPPIILLYGQSGAGKSSLLDAGLKPRLEQSHLTIYARRNGAIGLVETMRKALLKHLNHTNPDHSTSNFPSIEDAEKTNDNVEALTKTLQQLAQKHGSYAVELTHLVEKIQKDITQKEQKLHLDGIAGIWHRLESETDKPVVLILDQVEEMITHPNHKLKDEAKAFLKTLFKLFGRKNFYPKGRLVLAFRKEFAAEIERDMNAAHLPYSKVFLTKLNRENIIEVVRGVTSTERLRQRYQLHVEDQLPEMIADDLLEDKESPIAPVLQILLTKMWDKALSINRDSPKFSIALYENIKKEGLLMQDFLNQQLNKLSLTDKSHVESGLVLDILHFHTTKQRTSASQEISEVLNRYEGKEDEVNILLKRLTDLCLLISVTSDTRKLTHDTLAQIVSQKFSESVYPGQRATRILQYKMIDFDAGKEILLDGSDVRIIEEGLRGMRSLSENEKRLLDKSKDELQKRVVMQARKDAEIVYFRERSTEKEIESQLLRLQDEMDNQFRMKNDRSVAIAHAVYTEHPNHTQAQRMVYKLLRYVPKEVVSFNTFSKIFNEERFNELQSLEPPMNDEEIPHVRYSSPNNDWFLQVSFPANIAILDAFYTVKHQVNVVTRDYGLLQAVEFLPDNEHFLACTDDGKVLMWNRQAEQIFEIGDFDPSTGKHYHRVACLKDQDTLLLKTEKEIQKYPLNPQEILDKIHFTPLTEQEKKEFDIDW